MKKEEKYYIVYLGNNEVLTASEITFEDKYLMAQAIDWNTCVYTKTSYLNHSAVLKIDLYPNYISFKKVVDQILLGMNPQPLDSAPIPEVVMKEVNKMSYDKEDFIKKAL